MKMLGSVSVCYLSILWFSLPFVIYTRAADDVTLPTSLPRTAESTVDQFGITKEGSSSDNVPPEKKQPSLASKFAIQEPIFVRTTEINNKFRLDYPINDLINKEYTKVKVYENDCKQEFVMEGGPLTMNNSERLSSINENYNEHSTQQKTVVLEVDFIPGNYRPSWYQVFRSYWTNNKHHEIEICLRFMIFNRPTTNPNAIEVNFKESIVRMEIEKGVEEKPTRITNVTIEHVEPVGIQVHVVGESKAQVETDEESTATTTATASTPSSDEPKKLREDLIQQKLQEMLERDKREKQLLKEKENERPQGVLEGEL
jgi:hypothetical protein